MTSDGGHQHRASGLRQQNKKFKSKHASKGSLREKSKGKIERPLHHRSHISSVSSKASVSSAQSSAKADRRNAAKVHQRSKRQSLVAQNRVFAPEWDKKSGAPKIVAVVPLCPDVNATHVVETVWKRCLGSGVDGTSAMDVEELLMFKNGITGPVTLNVPTHHSRFQLLALPRSTLAVLDACKVADYVIFVLSAVEEVDAWGDKLLAAIKAQGVGTVVGVVQHLSTTPPRHHTGIRRSLHMYLQDHFPSYTSTSSRPFSLDVPADVDALVRTLATQRILQVGWRAGRSYLVGEGVQWVKDEEEGGAGKGGEGEGEETGLLKVTGWIRGRNLCANRLAYLVDGGDFAVRRIETPADHPSYLPRHTAPSSTTPTILALPDPSLRDDLVSSNPVDPLAQEQTWPTDEEMAGAEGMNGASRMGDGTQSHAGGKVKKMPKGTSTYQAAWLVDEEGEGEGDDVEEEEEENGDVGMSCVEAGPEADGDAENANEDDDPDADGWESMSSGSIPSDASDPADVGPASREAPPTREEQAALDLSHPDELDTPRESPARVRFAKYRGLADSRTSGWDPYENLPEEYGRVFAFEDWKRARGTAMARAGREGGDGKGAKVEVKKNEGEGDGMDVDEQDAVKNWVQRGTRVTVVLEGVPKSWVATRKPSHPIFLVSLLPHEHKYSLSHAHLVHHADHASSDPIKSKDPLILQVGFRRFTAAPVYSDPGQGSNGVALLRRFMYHGGEGEEDTKKGGRRGKEGVVATWFGPVCWDKTGVLAWKVEMGTDTPFLVATGTSMPSDVTRIIAKRVVLSGHPYKINKKTVVVRYMFFNPEDVDYFKPVQLRTKYGRSGTIRESVGTHGRMKCLFDGPMNAQDTVIMPLYKRVHPRWGTEVYKPTEPVKVTGEKGEGEQRVMARWD
ncbi:DUF663-domain-containing protein [Gonapodya prolifera JEL478]|uniref:DUF663-domain-containing protein n=1 Tax=Gonapodya prolifera (strain JEL478) TaxID=1344416 RepID=A0A138ZZJ2_GONPJ|nr:DUF663-domain-containing protein [Gonapodya prolifera JEL478]|eukprot:KXS09926.1 DUF663-domain-containing protein [Gonapodya prolifera JEL478]